jgi:hypothetical protein
VEDLMARQWQRHLGAARNGTVTEFLQEQLLSGTTSAHEMPAYVRRAVQTVFERFVQGPPKVGPLIKAKRLTSTLLAPLTYLKSLLPRQAQINATLTDALQARAPNPTPLTALVARTAITMAGFQAHVGNAKGHRHEAFLKLGTDALIDKLKLHPIHGGKMEVYWGARKAPEEFKFLLQSKAVDLYVQEHLDTRALDTPQLHPHAARFAVRTQLPIVGRASTANPTPSATEDPARAPKRTPMPVRSTFGAYER